MMTEDRAGNPDPGESAHIASANRLFARPCVFICSAPTVEALPEATLPEVAFAGRSNVGKSSLLNTLARRHALARTSRTPGRTQTLNFFRLADALVLVDLPGYGYARAPKANIVAWNRVVRDYLRGRPNLRRVVLLIDARHGIKPNDSQTMELLDTAAVAFQLVLTKTDLLRGVSHADRRDELLREAARHPAAHPFILSTSAQTGAGIEELRAALAELCDLSALH